MMAQPSLAGLVLDDDGNPIDEKFTEYGVLVKVGSSAEPIGVHRRVQGRVQGKSHCVLTSRRASSQLLYLRLLHLP